MAIRKLKSKEKLPEAYRSLAIGEQLTVPFKRYSHGYMKKLAAEIKRTSYGKRILRVETEGRMVDALITRTR